MDLKCLEINKQCETWLSGKLYVQCKVDTGKIIEYQRSVQCIMCGTCIICFTTVGIDGIYRKCLFNSIQAM